MKTNIKSNPKRKFFNKTNILILISITLLILAAIMLCISKKINNIIFAIIGVILCIIGIIILSIVLFFALIDMSKTMLEDYRNKNSLIEGVLCIILIVFSACILSGDMLIDNNFSGIIISLIPAMLSLLGVHYSNMTQEKRHIENFKIANTPYPLIEYCLEKTQDEHKGKSINVKIKNLADNILIPLYISNQKLNYSPVTKDIDREFKNINIPNSNCENVLFIYEDSLGNKYETKLDIKMTKDIQNKYITAKYDKPILLTDEKFKDYISSIK